MKVTHGSLKTLPIHHDLWRLVAESPACIIRGDEKLDYSLRANFRTDYRSGTKYKALNHIINWVLPKRGEGGLYDCAVFIHDANHNLAGLGLNFKETNKLFYDMLIYAGISKWRAKIAYHAVKLARKDFNRDNGTDGYNRFHDLVSFERSKG